MLNLKLSCIRIAGLATLYFFACNALLNGAAYAQAEQNTQTAQQAAPPTKLELERKHRQELDKWMLQAYEGDADAQFKVAILFTNTQIGKPDYEQAVYWYKQAARQGHILAQYNLGHQYLTGVGVIRNEATAMQWWRKAAEQDHALAQFNMGRAYYLGIGVKQDPDQAKYWFQRAAQNQEPKSIEILDQLGWSQSGNTSGPSVATTSIPQASSPQASTTPNENGDRNLSAQSQTQEQNIDTTPTNAALEEAPPIDTPVVAKDTSNSNLISVAPNRGRVIIKPREPDSQNPATNANEPIAVASQSDSAPQPETATVPESTPVASTTTGQTPQVQPVALYTDPALRSVLIGLIEDRNTLNVSQNNSADSEWVELSVSNGFPVWVHQNYITTNSSGDFGQISGTAVNARAVPIMTSGTVVGRFNRDENVRILEKRDTWYRVNSPNHFTAWAKRAELESPYLEPAINSNNTAQPDANRLNQVDDNRWLFSQPEDNYTLQLASFDDPKKVTEFLAQPKFIKNPSLFQFTSSTADPSQPTSWTYFLFGSFDNNRQAQAAREEISKNTAWVRSFKRLQENRCLAWKKQVPAPSELNEFCIR